MDPKYKQLKSSIIQMINSGEFKPGEKFYTENELKSKYDVSSITVVKALRELVHEGYIVRYQGKGTYVSKRRRNTLVKFTDLEESEQEEISKVKEVKYCTASELSKSPINSNVSENEDYIYVRREKYNGAIKYVISESYILAQYVDKKKINEPSAFDSIYDRIKEDSEKNLFECAYEQTDKILFPIFEDIAVRFNITEQTPLVFQEKTTFDSDNQIIEYTQSYKLSQYYGVLIEYHP